MREESCPVSSPTKFSIRATGTGFNRNRTFLWNGRLLTGKPRRQGQANLNLQAAFGAIACPDRASVKTHGTFGDGEAQTYPAGFTSAGIVDAIERTKELVQSFRGRRGRNPRFE